MKTYPGDVSNNEILQELRKHTERFDQIDERFEKMDQRFENVEKRMDRADGRMDGFEASVQNILEAINEESTLNNKRFERIEENIANIRSSMVTKEYLDEKLADLRFAPVLSSIQGK